MALNFDSNLFSNDVAMDNDKRMYIHPPAECTVAVADGTTITGNIFQIFDDDTTTFYQYKWAVALDSQSQTFTITLDFLQRARVKVLWVYYGLAANASRGPAGTTTLQTSTDGTNWTNIDTVSTTFGVTTTKTYSGSELTFRYLRFSTAGTTGSGAGTAELSSNVYEIYATMVN